MPKGVTLDKELWLVLEAPRSLAVAKGSVTMYRWVPFLAGEFSIASTIAWNLTNPSNAWVQSLISDGLFDLGREHSISAVDSIRCGGSTLYIKYVDSLVSPGIPSDSSSGHVSRKKWPTLEQKTLTGGEHSSFSKWDVTEGPIFALRCKYQCLFNKEDSG